MGEDETLLHGAVVALAQGDPSTVLAFGPAANFRLLANPDLFGVSAGPRPKLPKDTDVMKANAIQIDGKATGPYLRRLVDFPKQTNNPTQAMLRLVQ